MSKHGGRGSAGASELQDRKVRALTCLAEDLTVERDEAAFVRSSLQHVVDALGCTGGITFLLGPGGLLAPAAEVPLSTADAAEALELAQAAVAAGRPVIHEIPGGGWFTGAPLATPRRILGGFALHDPSSAAPDVEVLEVLGKLMGTGLDNMRLYADQLAASARAEVVNRIVQTLTAGPDLRTALPAFAAELHSLERFDRLACGFANDSGDYVEVAVHPEEQSWGLGGVLPMVGSGMGSVVLNSRPVLQPDLLHSHRFLEDMRLLEEGVRSYVLLPLLSRGRPAGVLALGSNQGGAYDAATLERLQPIIDSVALALDNVRLLQKTRELTIIDEVTPLYNFRFIHQVLDRELKLSDRYKAVLSLIFVDLDRFKPINDQWGHLRGSRVLREVGFLLRTAVRETDYPARYGGDEFVIILPQTEAVAAHLLADKLRALIEEHVFLQEEGINATIGCSLGVATYPTDASSKEALVRLADERMYADKAERKQGR